MAQGVAIAFPEMGGLKVVIYQDPESNSNVAIAFPEMGWLKEAGLAFRSKGMGRYNLIPIDV